MTENLVSIVVPIYNVEAELLQRALESVSQQSYELWECILVDDGSTNDSGKICDTYAEKDKRFIVIHAENGGVSTARNMGLNLAKGEFITFLDADDFLDSKAVKVLLDTIRETNADISVCCCQRSNKRCSPNKKEIKVLPREQAVEVLAYNTKLFGSLEPAAVWGKMFTRTAINNMRFNENINIGEDYLYNYQCILNSEHIAYVSEKLYNYTIVASSATHSGYNAKWMTSLLEMEKFRKENFADGFAEELLSRNINFAFSLYVRLQQGQTSEKEFLEEFIISNRKGVLKNKKINPRVKAALLLSYLGMDVTRHIFTLIG